MSKAIISPVARFSGTVIISDPLTLPQVVALEAAIASAQEARTEAESDSLLLPGLLICVEKWELDHLPKTVTADTFPGSPRDACKELVAWLTREVMAIFRGETELPLAS